MKEIILYSSETCGYCIKIKNFFNENGIAITHKDVNRDLFYLE